VLKHADAAMYQAKRAGRGRHALYCASDDTADRRLELTTRLRAALSRGELDLHYQPVYALASRTPVGVAFNASPIELIRPGFAHRLGERMAAYGVRRVR
jgi:predicted signal transduction protein with EAL and GGDEF domain